MKKNKVFKEQKFKVQIGINYNEENKLFKVQIRCVSLTLYKLSCSLYKGTQQEQLATLLKNLVEAAFY